MHALRLRHCFHLRALQIALRPAGNAVAQGPRLQPCRAASGEAGGGRQQIAPPDVQALARMAHIAVTEEEVKDWGPKIESIVDWFGQLQEVDVEGVPPALRADVEDRDTLRADQPRLYEHRKELLQQAPDMEGPFVKVPKIATAADN